MNKTVFVILWIAATCFMTASPLAQDFAGTPDDVNITLIYPEQVESGQAIKIYVRIDNTGEQTWSRAIGAVGTADTAASGYLADYCFALCYRPLTNLEPGQTLITPAGTLHPVNIEPGAPAVTLDYVQVVLGNKELTYSLRSEPVSIKLVYNRDTDPAANPVPPRLPLSRTDFVDVGDQLLVSDPNTGLEWLRLDASRSMSAQEILEALEPGGSLHEFRFARTSEIEEALLNHLHASGQQVSRNQLRLAPPQHLHSGIASFASLMLEQTDPDNIAVANGIVADKPLAEPGANSALTQASITIIFDDACSRDCETGLTTRGVPFETITAEFSRNAAWLVRGKDLPQRPSDQPSWFDGELWVPDISLEGQHYQAILKMTDTQLRVFQLAELSPVQSSTASIPIDLASGSLTLTNTTLINSDGTSQVADLEFLFVPGSSPQALELITPGVKLE